MNCLFSITEGIEKPTKHSVANTLYLLHSGNKPECYLIGLQLTAAFFIQCFVTHPAGYCFIRFVSLRLQVASGASIMPDDKVPGKEFAVTVLEEVDVVNKFLMEIRCKFTDVSDMIVVSIIRTYPLND